MKVRGVTPFPIKRYCLQKALELGVRCHHNYKDVEFILELSNDDYVPI